MRHNGPSCRCLLGLTHLEAARLEASAKELVRG